MVFLGLMSFLDCLLAVLLIWFGFQVGGFAGELYKAKEIKRVELVLIFMIALGIFGYGVASLFEWALQLKGGA